jgi:hypothetical protein
MAIIKACMVANTIQNTGKECDKAMGPAAMLIAVPKRMTFTLADLADPTGWLNSLIHASKSTRVYPLFGQSAPIREIANDKENDVIVTLDDGSSILIRYGFFNRMFSTTNGGLCYAKALQSLNSSGYSIIEIDKEGQMLCRDNGDDTFSGLVVDFMYAPSPNLADLKNPYKNHFKMSYDSREYVQHGIILAGAENLLALQGLIDATIVKLASTTTYLAIDVLTECGDADLVELLGAAWLHPSNFIVKDSSGSVQTISGVTNVAGHLHLAGTFTSAGVYTVTGAAPSVLLSNDIDGYEIKNTVSITIP